MDNSRNSGATTILCAPETRIINELKNRTVATVSLISGPQSGSFYYLTRENELVIGSSIDANIQISDLGVSRKHIKLYWSDDKTYIEDLKSSNSSYLNGTKFSDVRPIQDGDQIAIGTTTVIKFNISNQLDADYQRNIADQLTHDSLTDALNKRTFIQILYQEYMFAKRHSLAVCILFIDIDYFKNINDTYGHLAGDEILIHLSKLLLNSARAEDYVCRFGGEEFTLICRNLTARQGLKYAERIRTIIKSSNFTYEDKQIDHTVSIGISSFPEDGADSIAQLVKNADVAMYQAKKMGRDQAIAYTY